MIGKILKGIGGFYYVLADDNIYECKPLGSMRKAKEKPAPGDDVEIEVTNSEDMIATIKKILPRKNHLYRPLVSNIDYAVIVISLKAPELNLKLLDKLLISIEKENFKPIIVFSKTDLTEDLENLKKIRKIYEDIGYKTFLISIFNPESILGLKNYLQGKTIVFMGNSGVGKSSIINTIQNKEKRETGPTSKKLGRGRHTTRETVFIPVGKDSYIVDTPGFASFDLKDLQKKDLWKFYPEFAKYEKECKFTNCSHVSEIECGIKKAVSDKLISNLRYESYVSLYNELER